MYIVVGTPHVYRVQVPPAFQGYDNRRTIKNNRITLDQPEANEYADVSTASCIAGVVPNRERNLLIIWSPSTLYLWNCRPAVQLFAFSRSPESINEYGSYTRVIWKTDSSAVAVSTDKGYLLFFNIELEHSSGGFLSGWTGQKRFEKSNLDDDFLPWTNVVALQITPAFQIKTDGVIEDFCCIRDELLIALSNGGVQRISWAEGLVNFAFSFNINDVPFGLELQHFRGSVLSPAHHGSSKTFVRSILYSSLLAGFVITLADGRAGFITSPTLRFEPNKLQAVWAREVVDATGCQSVNNYYRLLCFGLSSGRVAVYCIGELTGSLETVHKLEVSPADCPDAHARCGAVTAMKWSPDDRVLAVAWANEGLAVYSVFGSLLFLSLTSLPAYCAPIAAMHGPSVSEQNCGVILNSLDWSPEGYQLWLIPRPGRCNFATLSLAKSALTRNPCESNHLHVLMQSDDCLYVGLVERLHSPIINVNMQDSGIENPSQNASNVGSGDSGPAVALSVVPIAPGLAYLADNWPITYSCISDAGDWLAVAGRTGLACFSLKRRQWKLFGNISQERDFVVSGGLVLWREFVIAIAYNLVGKRDELRFYPLAGRLDNSLSTVYRLETQALLLNCVQDMLIVFTVDCVVTVYYLRKRSTMGGGSLTSTASGSGSVERHKLVEINIGQFLAHPATVSHIALTTLSTDIVLLLANSNNATASSPSAFGTTRPRISDVLSPKSSNFNSTANSLLVTTSGRVLLLQADRPIISPSQSNTNTTAIFSTPVRIAENVEHLWLMACDPINNAALAETIWLYCGRHGANVWLPLVNATKADARSQAFLSKRVMLQVDCPIYPLTALLSVAAVVGAASETTASAFLPSSFKEKGGGGGVPISNRITRFEAIRTSHSYLPSILRQLLRRHLGLQALEVTRSWSHLANFPHVLELLLHQVVDEEALSKEPLPDPLLPRVVAFIQQFPDHSPAVVVQCARKMEAILWPYLFATVGPPRDLFADCLRRADLDTAVSYLIILHTTEQSSHISRQLTSELLTAVLEKRRWSLVQDILRFLRSIGSSCLESPTATVTGMVSPRPPPSLFDRSLDSASKLMGSGPLTPGTSAAAGSAAVSTTSQQWRVVPFDDESAALKLPPRTTPPPPVTPQQAQQQQQPQPLSLQPSLPSKDSLKDEVPVDIDLIERVVYPYLRSLLADKRLLDLGRLAAAVHGATGGFSLAAWLLNERQKDHDSPVMRLTDFVGTLHRLHAEFEWPYPVLVHAAASSSQLRQQASQNSLHQYGSQSNANTAAVAPGGATAASHNNPSSESSSAMKYRIAPVSEDTLQNVGDDIELVPKFSLSGKEPSDSSSGPYITSHCSGGDNNSDSESIMSHTESMHSLVSADGAVAVPPPNNVNMSRSGVLPAYRHEQHLRFMFKVMVEAAWYDWALLLSIILRDAKYGVEAVRSIIALMTSDESSPDNIGEARSLVSSVKHPLHPAIVSVVRDICIGFSQFITWSAQACPGYLAFAHVMDPQIKRLSFLLAQSPPTSPPDSRSESPRPAPSETGVSQVKKQVVSVPSESLPTTPAPPMPQIASGSNNHNNRPMSAAAVPQQSDESSSGCNAGENGNDGAAENKMVDVQKQQRKRLPSGGPYGLDSDAIYYGAYGLVDNGGSGAGSETPTTSTLSLLNPDDHLIAADQQLHVSSNGVFSGGPGAGASGNTCSLQ